MRKQAPPLDYARPDRQLHVTDERGKRRQFDFAAGGLTETLQGGFQGLHDDLLMWRISVEKWTQWYVSGAAQLLCEQSGQRHRERFGYSRHYKQAWVPFATFNATDVGQVYLGFEGQLLLSDAPFLADSAYVLAYDFAPILHCRIEHGGAYSL